MLSTLPNYVTTSSSAGSNGLYHVISTNGIDGLVAAATNLFTVPAGKTFVIHNVYARLTAVTGVATVGVVKISNVTDAVDLIANTTLTALVTAGQFMQVPPATSVNVTVPAGKVIAADFTTAYTVATVATLSIDLVGYLI